MSQLCRSAVLLALSPRAIAAMSRTSVTAGEHLEASGRWVVDRDHGQQFKAEEHKTAHPASAEGIERYLASGPLRALGRRLNHG